MRNLLFALLCAASVLHVHGMDVSSQKIVDTYMSEASNESVVMSMMVTEWTEFKAVYGRNYVNKKEEFMRFMLFTSNFLQAVKHNAGKSTFHMGVNNYSDWSEDEINRMLAYEVPTECDTVELLHPLSQISVPAAMDLRNGDGHLGPVVNQGQCSSGWVQAALEVYASFNNEFDVEKLDSIRQQVFPDACRRFGAKDAFRRLQKQGLVQKFATLPRGDEESLKKYLGLGKQPISVGINAGRTSFLSYSGGIYDDQGCSNNDGYLNHAVLLVGYGTEEGDKDYWIIKNSWGKGWGENGYARIARNKNNLCGIANDAVIINSSAYEF